MKLHMLKSVTDTINTSFIFETENGVYLLDGGFMTEEPYMREYLLSLGISKIKGWFLTHPHDDHVGCLLKLLEENSDIELESIYYNFPSKEFAMGAELTRSKMTTEELYDRLAALIKQRGIKEIVVNAGDKYDLGEMSVRVLRIHDDSITANRINNSSAVYRFEINGKSLLFLGDLGIEGGRQLLATVDPALIKSDYVQMAHHGQDGVERAVYEAIRPRFTFWCTPSWLWDNKKGRDGLYDTGDFQTIIVRGWMSEIHTVEHHYRMIDGTQVIEI